MKSWAKGKGSTVLEILIRGREVGTFLKMREKALQDHMLMLIGVREEGFLIGKVMGRKEGKAEVAFNLLDLGMDVSAIVQITGLTKEELKAIKH